MLRRKSKIALMFVAIGCALAPAFWCALSNRLESSSFGKIAISAGNGSTVYLIHESWGLHSDEISLTRNPDGCVPPNPATDYIDPYGDGHSMIYSSGPNGLMIFTDSGPASIHEPDIPWSGIKVSVQKTSAWGEMLRNPAAYGVTVVRVPLNEVCFKNFFRKAGTSLRQGR